jgi:hypothetical protein
MRPAARVSPSPGACQSFGAVAQAGFDTGDREDLLTVCDLWRSGIGVDREEG